MRPGVVWPGSNRQPASRTADLLPGESLTLTLSFDDIRAAVMGLRASVRGIVASPAPSVPPSPCVGLAPMLEIVDTATGWTQAAYSDPGPLREPVTEDGLAGVLQARFGYIGLARGLVARLNASRVSLPSRSPDVPPNPCLIALEFRNRDGELFRTRSGAAQIQAELRAGQTISLELSSADVVRGNRVAEIVHPLLTTQSPAHPPNPCDDVIGTVEIFDGLNGRVQSVWATPGHRTSLHQRRDSRRSLCVWPEDPRLREMIRVRLPARLQGHLGREVSARARSEASPELPNGSWRFEATRSDESGAHLR